MEMWMHERCLRAMVSADMHKKATCFRKSLRGTTRSRTGDTRIFSPLLYQLSYGTIVFGDAKIDIIFISAKFPAKKSKKAAFMLLMPNQATPLHTKKDRLPCGKRSINKNVIGDYLLSSVIDGLLSNSFFGMR